MSSVNFFNIGGLNPLLPNPVQVPIAGVIYFRPDLSAFPQMSGTYSKGAPSTWRQIYSNAELVVPSTPTNYSQWPAPRTNIDINLSGLSYTAGQYVAIAIHLVDTAQFSYYFFPNTDSGAAPWLAVTSPVKNDPNLSWINADDFSLGTVVDGQGRTRRKTVVFLCEIVANPSPDYIGFNLGVVAVNADGTVVVPFVIDPKIRNDG